MSSIAAAEPAVFPSGPPAGGPVAALRRDVDELAALNVGELADAELEETLVGVRAQLSRLEAVSARLLAAADRRGLADRSGQPSTANWYALAADLHPREAAGQLHTARTLGDDLPRLHRAAAEGTICWSKARIAAGHAGRVGEHLFAEAEPVLVKAATELSVVQFERLCKAVRARAEALLDADPDRAAFHRRYLQVSPVGNLVRIDGQLDRADGEVLLTALNALVNPATTPVSAKDGETDEQGKDLRTARQRRADALVWLAGHALNTADLPAAGGNRPHLDVLVDLDTLLAESRRLLDPDRAAGAGPHAAQGGPDTRDARQVYEAQVEQVARLIPALADHLATRLATQHRPGGAWTLERTEPIPDRELLRLTCDATLRRIIADGQGQPLDIGRATRVVPASMRAALNARDGGCVYPGCDRPPSWCEAHHAIHYLHGGRTALDYLASTCEHHHRWLHKTGATLIRSRDGRWRVVDYGRALTAWRRTGDPPVHHVEPEPEPEPAPEPDARRALPRTE